VVNVYNFASWLHGKPFVICKFRTMMDERDEKGNLMPDSERLTSLGQFLRKTSMDVIYPNCLMF